MFLHFFFFFFFFLRSVLYNLGRHLKEISNMCPLLKCASNYLRTAAPQFLDDMEGRGIARAWCLFSQFRKPSCFILVFFFFSFPVFFCCSFYSSGCYLNVLKCSPESGPVKIRVGEILVYGTAIPVYSSYCCSAQKPQWRTSTSLYQTLPKKCNNTNRIFYTNGPKHCCQVESHGPCCRIP